MCKCMQGEGERGAKFAWVFNLMEQGKQTRPPARAGPDGTREAKENRNQARTGGPGPRAKKGVGNPEARGPRDPVYPSAPVQNWTTASESQPRPDSDISHQA